MALKKTIVYKTVPIVDAYHRVTLPQISPDKNSMSFEVWVFTSREASSDGGNRLADACVFFEGVPFSLAGVDVFAQAYAYLATLAMFATAADVFEHDA